MAEEQAEDQGLSLLAREYFGDQYVGPVREEQETEEAEPEQESTEQESEEPEPEGEESEESEATEAEETAEEEGETIRSFDELIEAQEWDSEWAYSVEVPVKVDGEETRTSLKDLIASYQKQEAADRRLEEAKAKREEVSQELSSKTEALNEQYAQAARLIEHAENLLDRDTQAVDWQSLREEDPAEYSAKKAEIGERRQEIEQMKREAMESYRQGVQQYQQETQEQQRQRLQQEQQALMEKVPEWKDEATAQAEKSKLVQYLKSEGFEDQDVQSVQDHRLVAMARKAMLYDEGQAKVDTAKKRVRKAPKKVKPGAAQSAEEQSKRRERELKQKLAKSGDINDALALYRARKGEG